MTFLHLLTYKLIVSRLTVVSGSRTAFATVTTSISVDIQRVEDTKSVGYDGGTVKTYKIYAEVGTDIQDGDKLKDLADSSIYKVMAGGVNVMTLGNLDHLEILVQKIND